MVKHIIFLKKQYLSDYFGDHYWYRQKDSIHRITYNYHDFTMLLSVFN